MRVFLCEKPSQSKAISARLGITNRTQGYYTDGKTSVINAFGHLLSQAQPAVYNPELDKSKQGWKLELLPVLPEKWVMQLPATDPKNKSRYDQAMKIKSLLSIATEVVIATDDDREGETIAVELLVKFGYKGSTKRMIYSSMDDASLDKALNNLIDGKSTYSLYTAGLGRMRADWLLGMNMTMALTATNKKMIPMEEVLSVGRVQSPIVYLIVSRELEIKNFKPVPFYKIDADFNAAGGKYSGSMKIRQELLNQKTGYLDDPEKLKVLLQELRSTKEAEIVKYTSTEKKTKCPIGFSLNELQQECSKRFGYKAKETLDIAQKLYEIHKLTSYPRSDCGYMEVSQLADVPNVLSALKSNFSDKSYDDLLSISNPKKKSSIWDNSKVTAHHAIIPTVTNKNVKLLSKDEWNVYDLISRRYIMQFLPEYISTNVTVETKIMNDIFNTSGSTTVDLGWKKADPKLKESNKSIPALKKGEIVNIIKIKDRKEETKPPPSYTESALLDDMVNIRKFIENEKLKKIIKKAGIGTEATRANHIENIEKKGYIERKGQKILPTEKAYVLMEILPDILKKPETTAYWEEQLNLIVSGDLTLEKFINRIIDVLNRMVNQVKEGKCQLSKPVSSAKGKIYTCDKCSGMVKKIKTKAKNIMWVCDSCKVFYADVVGRRGALIVRIEQPKGDFPCEVCKKSQMLRRKKKEKEEYFWVCGDKTCNVFAADDNGKLGAFNKPKVKETSEHSCPVCKKGDLIKKFSAKNVAWWGCNGYPKCKTTFFDDNGKPKIEEKKKK